MCALHSESLSMRGRLDSELVSVSQWFNGKSPVHKTGDLRLKSQLRYKFISQYLSVNSIFKAVGNRNIQ